MLGYYKYEIDLANISDEDKKILKNFLELLDKYKYEPDKLTGVTHEKLSHVFEIAKFNSKLQIEIWQSLPKSVVKNPENLEIFEYVLENKFGEYIKGIDKKELVKLLNNSETYRSNG